MLPHCPLIHMVLLVQGLLHFSERSTNMHLRLVMMKINFLNANEIFKFKNTALLLLPHCKIYIKDVPGK